MSIDTILVLRTPLSAGAILQSLRAEPDFDGGEDGEDGLRGSLVSLIIRPWTEEDYDFIDGAFKTASVVITFIPKTSDAGFAARRRLLATILRTVPGDAYAIDQDAASLGLLRLGGVVYVDPDQLWPQSLAENGYTPEKLVVGAIEGIGDATLRTD